MDVRHSSGIAFPPSKALELKSLKASANDIHVASATTHPYHRLRGLHQFVLILKNKKWLAILLAGLDLMRAL